MAGCLHSNADSKEAAMMMRKRRLGTTELEITTVGFGAWAIGGGWAYGWRPQDDARSVAAIRHAVNLDASDLADIADVIRRCRAGSGPLAPAESEVA
jgi:hypothetical protein